MLAIVYDGESKDLLKGEVDNIINLTEEYISIYVPDNRYNEFIENELNDLESEYDVIYE